MERINGLDINKTDRVYKMQSGRMLKVRVLKLKVLPTCVSFIISCSHVDEKGKALFILNEVEDGVEVPVESIDNTDDDNPPEQEVSYILAPPFTVTIPFDTLENPVDILTKQIEGHSFTKADLETGVDKETVVPGRLEIDDSVFKTMEDLNNLEKNWSES